MYYCNLQAIQYGKNCYVILKGYLRYKTILYHKVVHDV